MLFKKMIFSIFFLIPFLVFLTLAQDYSQFAHQKQINFDCSATGANLQNDTKNLPVLIRLDESNFDFQTKPEGSDIRFSTTNGTALPYFIERWNRDDKIAEIWVKVDIVKANNPGQHIKMYWDNDEAFSQSDQNAVFDVSHDLIGVWNLNGLDNLDEATRSKSFVVVNKTNKDVFKYDIRERIIK